MLSLLIDCAAKGTVLLALAFVGLGFFRRASAAPRHLFWCCALVGLLALPALSMILPAWRVLPGWMQPKVAASIPTLNPARPPTDISSSVTTVSPAPDAQPPAPQAKMPRAIDTPTRATPAAAPARAMPAAAPPRSASFTWPSWETLIVWAYFAAFAVALLPVGLAYLMLARMGRTAAFADWSPLLDEFRGTLGVTRHVRLVASGPHAMPMTWGLWHAVILLPASASAWPEDRRRCVLLHELAHVKRFDTLSFLLARLACAAYWFHPLAWLAAARLRAASEVACDDMVLAAGTKSSTYAAELMTLAETSAASRIAPYAAIAMARTNKPSQLHGRITAILDKTRRRGRLTRAAALAGIAVVVGLLLPLACMKAASPNASATAPSLTRQADDGPVTAWGEAVDGVQLGLRLPKRKFLEGDTLQAQVVARNLGSEDKTLWNQIETAFTCQPFTNAIVITDGFFPIAGSNALLTPEDHRLAPEQELVLGDVSVGGTPLVLHAGKYRVSAHHEPSILNDTARAAIFSGPMRNPSTRLTTGEVTIEVTAATGNAPAAIAPNTRAAAPADLLVQLVDEQHHPLVNQSLALQSISAGPALARGNSPGGPFWAAKDGTVSLAASVAQGQDFVIHPSWPVPTFVHFAPPYASLAEVVVKTPDVAVHANLNGVRAVAEKRAAAAEVGSHYVIVVSITNDSDQPYHLTENDLQVISPTQRIFPPVGGPAGVGAGATVPAKGKGTLELTLGWDDYVNRGRWTQRDEMIDEKGWPAEPVGEGLEAYRVVVANHSSLPFILPDPIGASWGKAVNGIQLRLRPAESTWNVDPRVLAAKEQTPDHPLFAEKMPTLRFDVRNVGAKVSDEVALNYMGYKLEVDGKEYVCHLVDVLSMAMKPGQLFGDMELPLNSNWGLEFPAALTPGKHTVRVFMPLGGEKVYSNAATVEIAARAPATTAVSEGTATRGNGPDVDGAGAEVVVLEAKQTDFAPVAGVWYALHGSDLYKEGGEGPAEIDTARAWATANEFVYRTALRNVYRLPAESAGPKAYGEDAVVAFARRDAGPPLRIRVAPEGRRVQVLTADWQGVVQGTAPAATKPATAAELVVAFRGAPYGWQQAEIAGQLVALGDKSVVPAVAELLTSEKRWERCNAGVVLAGLGDARGLQAILAELQDTGDRPATIRRDDGTPSVALQITEDRRYAAWTLGHVIDPRAVGPLIAVLKEPVIQVDAAYALGEQGDPRAIGPLKEMMATQDANVQFAAAAALARLRDPTGPLVLMRLLLDPSETMRRNAAEELGKQREAGAVKALVGALKDVSPDVRIAAVRALGKIGDAAALPALAALSTDTAKNASGPPTSVAEAAKESIKLIQAAQPAPRPAAAGEAAQSTGPVIRTIAAEDMRALQAALRPLNGWRTDMREGSVSPVGLVAGEGVEIAFPPVSPPGLKFIPLTLWIMAGDYSGAEARIVNGNGTPVAGRAVELDRWNGHRVFLYDGGDKGWPGAVESLKESLKESGGPLKAAVVVDHVDGKDVLMFELRNRSNAPVKVCPSFRAWPATTTGFAVYDAFFEPGYIPFDPPPAEYWKERIITLKPGALVHWPVEMPELKLDTTAKLTSHYAVLDINNELDIWKGAVAAPTVRVTVDHAGKATVMPWVPAILTASEERATRAVSAAAEKWFSDSTAALDGLKKNFGVRDDAAVRVVHDDAGNLTTLRYHLAYNTTFLENDSAPLKFGDGTALAAEITLMREGEWHGLALARDATNITWDGKEISREVRVAGTDWVVVMMAQSDQSTWLRSVNGLFDERFGAIAAATTAAPAATEQPMPAPQTRPAASHLTLVPVAAGAAAGRNARVYTLRAGALPLDEGDMEGVLYDIGAIRHDTAEEPRTIHVSITLKKEAMAKVTSTQGAFEQRVNLTINGESFPALRSSFSVEADGRGVVNLWLDRPNRDVPATKRALENLPGLAWSVGTYMGYPHKALREHLDVEPDAVLRFACFREQDTQEVMTVAIGPDGKGQGTRDVFDYATQGGHFGDFKPEDVAAALAAARKLPASQVVGDDANPADRNYAYAFVVAFNGADGKLETREYDIRRAPQELIRMLVTLKNADLIHFATDPAWSKQAGGLRARLLPQAASLKPGDMPTVSLEIQNPTDKPVSLRVYRPAINVSDVMAKETSVFLEIGGANGARIIAGPGAHPLSPAEMRTAFGLAADPVPTSEKGGGYTLEPWASITITNRLRVPLPETGDYVLSARYPIADPTADRDLLPSEYLNVPEITYLVADKATTAPATAPAPTTGQAGR